MTDKHSKIAAVNRVWGAVIVGVATASIIGSGAYAWNTNAQIAVMNDDIKDLKDIGVGPRMAVVEKTVARIEGKQDKMDDKLDRLLENRR